MVIAKPRRMAAKLKWAHGASTAAAAILIQNLPLEELAV